MIFSARFILLITFSVIISGCQTMDNMVKKFQDFVGISIDVEMYNPPNYPATTKIKKIAIIGGDTDIQVRNEVEAMFTKIQANNRPYFTVVERQDQQRIRNLHTKELTEHEFDKDAVAEYGRWLGAEGIYMVTNVKNSDADSTFTKKRSECSKWVKKKCKSYRKYTVSCEKRSVNFSFTPKLVDVSTLQIIYGRNISIRQTDEICSDTGRPLRATGELLATAKLKALGELRKDVSFYTTTEKVLIKTSDTENKKAEKLLEDGEKFAVKGRWERACDIWKIAAEEEPQSPSPWYNLGICSERTGKLQMAFDLYRKADQLTTKPDQRITDRMLSTQKKLQRDKARNQFSSIKE